MINAFLLQENKFMFEIYLRQSGFRLKKKKEYKYLKK